MFSEFELKVNNSSCSVWATKNVMHGSKLFKPGQALLWLSTNEICQGISPYQGDGEDGMLRRLFLDRGLVSNGSNHTAIVIQPIIEASRPSILRLRSQQPISIHNELPVVSHSVRNTVLPGVVLAIRLPTRISMLQPLLRSAWMPVELDRIHENEY
jgi:hypothetical protein